ALPMSFIRWDQFGGDVIRHIVSIRTHRYHGNSCRRRNGASEYPSTSITCHFLANIRGGTFQTFPDTFSYLDPRYLRSNSYSGGVLLICRPENRCLTCPVQIDSCITLRSHSGAWRYCLDQHDGRQCVCFMAKQRSPINGLFHNRS